MSSKDKTKQVICHDIYGKLYKADVKKLVFRPSIYGILIEKNKVLLSKQWDGYDFPGGGAELYETIDQALIREFWEETGFKIKPLKIIQVASSFFYPLSRNSEKKKTYWNCQLFYFSVKKLSGKLSKANFDDYEKKYAGLAEWIYIRKLGRLKFYNQLGRQGSLKIINQTLNS